MRTVRQPVGSCGYVFRAHESTKPDPHRNFRSALGVTATRGDERRFTYSYEPETLPQGAMEFEQWITLRTQRTQDGDVQQDNFNRSDIREELEYYRPRVAWPDVGNDLTVVGRMAVSKQNQAFNTPLLRAARSSARPHTPLRRRMASAPCGDYVSPKHTNLTFHFCLDAVKLSTTVGLMSLVQNRFCRREQQKTTSHKFN